MIVVTGAAGFIASNLIGFLNQQGITDIVAVDKFRNPAKKQNLEGKSIAEQVEREIFHEWLEKYSGTVKFIFHLGARTDTTETNRKILQRLNTNYSIELWKQCVQFQIPLLYASSAATYGAGEHGFDDRHETIPWLKPLNEYGKSKNDFDNWALQQNSAPPFWAGMKFFNVYGSNEYHKGRMASVIFHAFKQVQETGGIKLFRSHRQEYKDGAQLRDFIYVQDVLRICYFFFTKRPASGIYNVGTGKAQTFNDLANALFTALGKKLSIEYIDMPLDIRANYQYFTEANISKLKQAGYDEKFFSLEDGVGDYVKEYLLAEKHF
ncbi:MAG: ADP-glyceromanno-heptose 6-epimerase [Chitinophagales bacterium]|nr:ADP-glyceromanno-heptose 6-epimerase [Chitinophagales bacterium]